jgi:hypothetical protein
MEEEKSSIQKVTDLLEQNGFHVFEIKETDIPEKPVGTISLQIAPKKLTTNKP